ncbi:MAG: hypothetical protein M0T84_10825 [Betaproteobacteria bacterium]|nr:hypothetical protein [Betaproteobacteria bacterium]
MNKTLTQILRHALLAALATFFSAFTAGAAQAAPQLQMQINANTLGPLIQEHNLEARAYFMQVEQIVAHKVRKLRVAEERNDIAQMGHPVELPTGICDAIVSIKPDGTVFRTELGACRHQALGVTLKEAINEASPLPPPGQAYNLTIAVNANVPTPGYDGN